MSEFQNRYSNYLLHYGVKGMKWGVRRYQNEDGTLTALGKQRYYGDADRRMSISKLDFDDIKDAKSFVNKQIKVCDQAHDEFNAFLNTKEAKEICYDGAVKRLKMEYDEDVKNGNISNDLFEDYIHEAYGPMAGAASALSETKQFKNYNKAVSTTISNIRDIVEDMTGTTYGQYGSRNSANADIDKAAKKVEDSLFEDFDRFTIWQSNPDKLIYVAEDMELDERELLKRFVKEINNE